ncbi:dormancy/auxin associated family protein [Striga asiatica]|uniref:Dormancy/auxin associated family protein n=1 Tax=Striga asiatica TaxID=4170 RepID=A0A5A7QJM5_STRAF|nr:dormancy/auxin associated family protein [Striga asiatica]
MGFLHKLWDETLAGPAPESGLGKLRKYNSFNAAGPPPPDDVQISRSITVLRGNAHRNLTVSVGAQSAPSSPSGSTAPNSPFSPSSPGGNVKKLSRRKSAANAMHNSDPKSPTSGYDWILLNSWDR